MFQPMKRAMYVLYIHCVHIFDGIGTLYSISADTIPVVDQIYRFFLWFSGGHYSVHNFLFPSDSDSASKVGGDIRRKRRKNFK